MLVDSPARAPIAPTRAPAPAPTPAAPTTTPVSGPPTATPGPQGPQGPLYGPFVPNGPTTQPAQQPDPTVDQATQKVKEKLDQSGWFNDVTNDELHDISATFDGLTPAQRNEVLGRLSDAELKTWAGESGSLGILGTGGINRSEKQALFEDLAAGADAAQLERLSNAFSGEDDAKLLGDAIASHAPPATQLAFVQRMAGKVESNERIALQVAKAIGGMKNDGTYVDQALAALTDGQLGAVVKAAQQENLSTHATSTGAATSLLTYDVGPLQAMIDAAATGSSVEQKARLFDSAANVLGEIAKIGSFNLGMAVVKNDAEAKLTQSLSRLITSDTNGVMAELESQFRSGKAITTFTKQMIEQGRTEELKVIVTQLQRGNDLKGDALQRFSTPNAEGEYANAQVLGYFVGSVHAAAYKMRGDVDRQVSTFKAIFGGTLSGGKDVASNLWLGASASKALLGLGVGVTAAVGLVTADQIGRDMKSGILNEREALTEFAYPREANGRLYEGQRAETAYDTASNRVFVENQ